MSFFFSLDLADSLKGFQQLGRKLEKEVMQEAGFNAAAVVAAKAKQVAPRRSGTLAGDIRPGRKGRAGVVRVGSKKVPYAGPIHFGWRRRNIRPQPFLYQAAGDSATANQIVQAYSDAVQQAIEESELD